MWSNFSGESNEEEDDGSRWHRIHERTMQVLSGNNPDLKAAKGTEYLFTYRQKPVYRSAMLGCPCVCEDSNGVLCTRQTLRFAPFCEECMLNELHLQVKPSTGGEKAGMGLFAHHPRRSRLRRAVQPRGTVVFRAGEVIIPYYGETIDLVEFNRRYRNNPDIVATYCMGIDEEQNFTADCGRVRSPGSYANDYRGIAEERNTIFVGNGDVQWPMLLVAEKTIYDGDEILADYGDDYWSTSGASQSFTRF